MNLPAILGNFDRPTDRPTDDGQIGSSVGFTSNKEREKENEEINPFTLPAQLFHFQYRGPRSLRPAAEFPGSWMEKKDYSPISDFFYEEHLYNRPLTLLINIVKGIQVSYLAFSGPGLISICNMHGLFNLIRSVTSLCHLMSLGRSLGQSLFLK